MWISGASVLSEAFLYGTFAIAFTSLLITKNEWQRVLAYGLAIFGLAEGLVFLVLDLTNSGIMIYLLAWSMSVSVGYGREYFNLKWFFSFMSLVLVLFAFDLYFAPDSAYSGTEKLFNILSGTGVIAMNIYLWASEARMNSNHYSERRQKYEDIATLSGKMSSILAGNDEIKRAFLTMADEMAPRLGLDCCMIFLLNEDNELQSVDDKTRIALENSSAVSESFRKQKDIVVSDTLLTNFDRRFSPPSAKSEMAVPIYEGEKVQGAIYGCSSERNFFRERHFQAFNVIASFCGIKLTQNSAIASILAAEHYKELDEMKNRFIANVSHDLKTPLSLIKGPAKQIAQLSKDPKVQSLADYITQNSDHLLRVVHQLLQLNRVDKGINELYIVDVDLRKISERIRSQYQERAESKGILLRSECDPLHVKTDLFRLEQIIHNLLSNALRYTKSGKIELHIKQIEGHCVIEVQDTGIGIPAEKIGHIFERFFKVDQNNQEGTGIGLSLVHEYVEALEGTIDVNSQVGVGSRFTVHLPLYHSSVDSVETAPKIQTETASIESEGGMPQMLIVEDHAGLNEFICNFFESSFSPVAAFDGNEALQKMRMQLPDIIITDLMMPNRDGKSFVEEIRANEEYDHIPIIVLSANAQLSSKVEMYERGIDNFLAKPFEIEELEAVVNATMARRKKQRKDFRDRFLEFSSEASEALAENENDLIQKVKTHLLSALDNPELSVNEVASALGYGRNRFQKEIKDLTGVTPVEFIRSFRLQEAYKMLRENPSMHVSEVAYAVGFNNLSYFTRSFRQEFDLLPSDVQ
jgi:DNA-binding response OmpR family regulator/nitrogen-specific signal transduction histidine kinase